MDMDMNKIEETKENIKSFANLILGTWEHLLNEKRIDGGHPFIDMPLFIIHLFYGIYCDVEKENIFINRTKVLNGIRVLMKNIDDIIDDMMSDIDPKNITTLQQVIDTGQFEQDIKYFGEKFDRKKIEVMFLLGINKLNLSYFDKDNLTHFVLSMIIFITSIFKDKDMYSYIFNDVFKLANLFPC